MADSYKILEHIATISENKYGSTLELNRVMWNGRDARLDLRRWGKNENGERVPFKGICLTESEWAFMQKMFMEG